MAENVTVVPWGLHPLSSWVVDELKRRSKEYGINPSPTENKPYSGPRTAWVRFFSNGISKLSGAKDLDGFVLGGVHGFDDSYGFNSKNLITIGVDAQGRPHQVPIDTSTAIATNGQFVTRADFPHRPPPNVESISCEMNGTNSGFPNLCRKITVNWKCHSLSQLNYLIPYFLTPRTTCLVEWGWNNYDNVSLVDLTDLNWLNNMFVDPSYTTAWIKKSNGNYDAGIGFITDFGFKMNDAGGYDCYTTLTNANRLIEGEQIDNKTVTRREGENETEVKSFRQFVERNLSSIDSARDEYVKMRQDLKLDDGKTNIYKKIFRTRKTENDKNADGLWLRMDLIQSIINAFFQISMENPKTAVIRNFDINDTRMCASPFLKSTNKNVLIPNQYAPRFIIEDEKATKSTAKMETEIYNQLFKEKVKKINDEYGLIEMRFDDLKQLINPSGKDSFPVYRDEDVMDANGKKAQALKSGYWGYLRDLYINAAYFKELVSKNDSVLKMIEQLLQGINEALCQTCQLKLIPAQYANSKYSVYDENLPGISTENDAADLPRIQLGALNSAFIKSATFDVKISPEMMNQLVMQSANPDQDPDGSTNTKNVKANPIISRDSAGDRLYRKGEIKTTVVADSGPTSAADSKKAADEAAKKLVQEQNAVAESLKKKREERSEEKFKKAGAVYYKKNEDGTFTKYFLYEPTKDFLNYLVSIPNKNAPYLNNGIMPGTTLTLELLGISGVDYLSQFTIDHAPESYSYSSAVWQITDVRQTVEDKAWTTTVVASVRPLTILK